MSSRIGGYLQPVATSADRRDLNRIKDKFIDLYNQSGAIGPAQAQALINETLRDGQLTAAEANFLAQTFQANAQIFTPDAAQMVNQFLGQSGMNMNAGFQPQFNQPQGWIPGGQPQGYVPGAMGIQTPEIQGLRQSLGQLMQSGNPISGADARMLINRAMSNRDTAPMGVQILTEAFQMNRGAFTPEAGMVLNNFLMTNQPGAYGAAGYGYGSNIPSAAGWSAPMPSAAGGWGNPYGGRVDGFDNGMRPVTRNEQRQLTNLRDDFVQMLTNDGMVTGNEVQKLLSNAMGGQLNRSEVGLLAQGFRDNQGRFTPDAGAMMMQFLRQYGF